MVCVTDDATRIATEARDRVRFEEEALALVAPAARDLGSEALLARLDPATCEGDRQLEVGRADGLPAALADVVARTVGSSP